MSRDRPVIEPISSPAGELPSRTRSAVTNQKDLLPGLDGRSATARRFRDLVNAFVADMGGLDCCSEIKLGLLRRLAATTVQAEIIEARMVNGEEYVGQHHGADQPTLGAGAQNARCDTAATIRLCTRWG